MCFPSELRPGLWAALLLSAFFVVVSSFGREAGAVENLDVFVNDDGMTCFVMVDLYPHQKEIPQSTNERDVYLRQQVALAVSSQPDIECAPESTTRLLAILVSRRDAYGQPHWGSVEYLSEYAGEISDLRELDQENMTPEALERLLSEVEQ